MLRVPGLRNSGHVCYFNSTLQALASCRTFIESLQSCLNPSAAASELSPNDGIAGSLLHLLTELQPSTTNTTSKSCQDLLKSLRAILGHDLLPPGLEHDAAEGLQLLLHCLQTEIESHFCSTRYNTLILQNALQALRNHPGPQQEDLVLRAWRKQRLCCEGSLATDMRCLHCRHHFTTQVSPFTLLSLEIPAAKSRNLLGTMMAATGTRLENCLETMAAYEAIQGVRCPGCSLKTSLETYIKTSDVELPQPLQSLQSCIDRRAPIPCGLSSPSDLAANGVPYLHVVSTVARRTEICRWPATLIIQLRRTGWDPSGEQVKVCGHVDFPLHWRPPRETRDSPAHSDSVASSLETIHSTLYSYSLVAVIVHTGLSSDTGHYTTYRKVSEYSGQGLQASPIRWKSISDEAEASVEESEVLAAHAVLLFYERDDLEQK